MAFFLDLTTKTAIMRIGFSFFCNPCFSPLSPPSAKQGFFIRPPHIRGYYPFSLNALKAVLGVSVAFWLYFQRGFAYFLLCMAFFS